MRLDGDDAARMPAAINATAPPTDFRASTILIRLFRDHARGMGDGEGREGRSSLSALWTNEPSLDRRRVAAVDRALPLHRLGGLSGEQDVESPSSLGEALSPVGRGIFRVGLAGAGLEARHQTAAFRINFDRYTWRPSYDLKLS